MPRLSQIRPILQPHISVFTRKRKCFAPRSLPALNLMARDHFSFQRIFFKCISNRRFAPVGALDYFQSYVSTGKKFGDIRSNPVNTESDPNVCDSTLPTHYRKCVAKRYYMCCEPLWVSRNSRPWRETIRYLARTEAEYAHYEKE